MDYSFVLTDGPNPHQRAVVFSLIATHYLSMAVTV
uniref:Uncharacterized protein n=1 Tax=Anguilla anguilla TaxID=7936 RepID=A0A0E9PJR1_ANGAN